jgi:X-X-X-Leu-X-X-Gly heptad repeat protein
LRRYVAVVLLVGAVAPKANGQATPTTFNLAPTVQVASGATTLNGSSGTLTSGLGAVGANPGWTYHAYGVASSSAGSLTINSTSASPASLKYFTSDPGNPTVSAAPVNFSNLQPYTWTIIGPKPGSTAPLYVRADDATGVNFTTGAGALPLNVQTDLATYNARLNAIYKFDATSWIDPATGVAIDISGLGKVGDFSYSFSGWDGTSFRTIDLVYTPVPEPGIVLLVAGLGGLACRHVRRRLRRTPTAV